MATSWPGYGPSEPPQGPGDTGSPKKKLQPRQLLSCTKCRERKVKCDRTKPCSACCARGHPKECQFIVGEGNDYSPIQQSYEIRKLRAENQHLKERLQAARLPHSGDERHDSDLSERGSSRAANKAAAARQRKFKTCDRTDNLYFGTPGLATIIADFANLQVGSHSLTHTMPRGRDMYPINEDQSMYPFPIFASWAGEGNISSLLQVLPPQDELMEHLDTFQRRAQSCSFPHTPDEVTKKEVERFLSDADNNANRFPDMLALIFVTLATCLQMGVYDRSNGQWVAGAMRQTAKRSDVYLAASMQALRLASFMSQPTLLGIQTLIMIGPYLTNSGRFLDAWTLFGTTIRMAHSIGMHRNPKNLDPAPDLRECGVRQTLWWWMLHMDQQYSVTLGRPLGISGFGDCPPPEPLTTNPMILRLGEFVDHFTILARQILGSDGMMSVARIDEFTDKLMGLWDTMPEALQFNESWSRAETSLPDWPLDVMSATLSAKVQSFIILLNRQRVERTQSAHLEDSPPYATAQPMEAPEPTRSAVPYGGAGPSLHPAPIRGRALVINSSIHLLQTFLFFWHRNPAVLICWTMGQQAFNASMILILDAWETGNEQNEWLISQAFVVFSELDNKEVHKLAKLAVKRISDGLAQLGNRRMERERAVAALSRRSSIQQGQQQAYPMPATAAGMGLTLDTAQMADLSGDTVMGNTGMFLLEDPGLQFYAPLQGAFQPLGWNMAGSAHHSNPSAPPTPNVPSPTVPISQVTVAPFPVMSPTFMQGEAIPITNSPYAVGLQPRMPVQQVQQQRRAHVSRHGSHCHQQAAQVAQVAQAAQMQQAAFTPINTGTPILQHSPAGFRPLNPAEAQALAAQQQQRQGQQQTLIQQQQARDQSFPHLRGPSSHSHSHGQQGSSAQGRGSRAHRLDRPPGRSQVRRSSHK